MKVIGNIIWFLFGGFESAVALFFLGIIYSRRPGTPADKMPGQLSNAVKEERSRAAIQVAAEMADAYRKNLINTSQIVLFEQEDGVYYTGYTPNYVKVYAKGRDLHNEIRQVRLTELFQDGVLGELV